VKTQFYIRGLNLSAKLRRSLKQPLERLQNLISITTAAVVLEHRRNHVPAFRVFVSLALPGPDIHADARDHTLEAAWLKVTTALRKQIEQRKTKQIARIKSIRPQPIFLSPFAKGGAPR
jgi:ribosome-associated translation inhibitor RaiA